MFHIKEPKNQRIINKSKVEHSQGHSLHSAGVSTAKSNVTNISDLLLAGGWSHEKKFSFIKFSTPCTK